MTGELRVGTKTQRFKVFKSSSPSIVDNRSIYHEKERESVQEGRDREGKLPSLSKKKRIGQREYKRVLNKM